MIVIIIETGELVPYSSTALSLNATRGKEFIYLFIFKV